MKKLLQKNYYLIYLVLIAFLFAISCNNEKEEKNIISNQEKNKIEINIDFKLIAYLNDSNSKVIEIATKSFLLTDNFDQLRIINNVKNSHIKIQKDLIKIAEKNLVIIPKPIYNIKLNNTFLNNQNKNYYLLNVLEKSIQEEINILENIEKSTQNISFKVFATKSKEILITNKKLLNIL
jgi:hypothetical protein